MAVATRRTAVGAAGVPGPVLILILAAGVFTTGLNITALGPLIRLARDRGRDTPALEAPTRRP